MCIWEKPSSAPICDCEEAVTAVGHLFLGDVQVIGEFLDRRIVVETGGELLLRLGEVHAQLLEAARYMHGPGGVPEEPLDLAEDVVLRLLPAAQVPQAVLRDLGDYRGSLPLDGDALVVCLDWFGR